MSVVLYQMPHSPYAIPIRQALIACGVCPDTRDVPNWDRGEIIRLTGGASYQIPLLVHNGRTIFESEGASLDIARYIDNTWGKGQLFPESLSAPNLCLIEWIEDAVEARTFKLADVHYVPSIEDVVARTMVVRHKERKFGKGCVEQWTQSAGAIRAELDCLLSRCEATLRHSPFLLGTTPVYADFALFGVLGNLTHNGWNQLCPDQNALQHFASRLQAWRFL
jgi:glutathione S-transferase